MNAFTYKGYGRIYTNPENIQDVENIIKFLNEFEWDYYPKGLVASWDIYPNVAYVGKFELDEEKFKELCKKAHIPVFVLDGGIGGNLWCYEVTLNKDEIKQRSYGELK